MDGFNKKINKGFTLIELMVVIAIIGILATVIIVNISGGRSTARDGAIQAQLTQAQAAFEKYTQINQSGTYMSAVGLSSAGSVTSCSGIVASAKDLKNICEELVYNAGSSSGSSNFSLFADSTSYSIFVKSATNTANYLCVDNAGGRGIIPVTTTLSTTACQ